MSNLKPRWMRELERYLPIKTQFYISGNIYDQILYPIRSDGGEQWVYLNIRDFFYRFFLERGYKIIGFFDLVDGIEFKNEEMYKDFRRVIRGKEVETEKESQKESDEPKLKQMKVKIDEALDNIRKAVSNQAIPTVFIIDYSSRLTSSPNQLYDQERIHFLKILKCAQDAAVVTIGEETFNNLTILLCDRLNDIPPWLYLNNPLTKPLQIEKPDEEERRKFITFSLNRDDFPKFYDSTDLTEEEKRQVIERFVDLTDGLGNYELESLRVLSEREKISIRDTANKPSGIKNIVERYKFGIVESAWDKVSIEKLKNAEDVLRQRVKGQEEAIQSVLDIIKRSKWGFQVFSIHLRRVNPEGFFSLQGQQA